MLYAPMAAMPERNFLLFAVTVVKVTCNWYENVWDRYWERLSLAEQDAFIDGRRSSTNAHLSGEEWNEWLDAIRTRDARHRERLRDEYLKADSGEPTRERTIRHFVGGMEKRDDTVCVAFVLLSPERFSIGTS
ncbi:hypothetical protein [Burkholderia sp. GS2Y]|uniref:Uncharacterized protein n=1 Tax=Burkholderia theae TaxID=3143496 RepID=A0ABU9WSR8_9BURK